MTASDKLSTATSHDDTLRERLTKMLVRYGMQKIEAVYVLNNLTTAADTKSMLDHWDEKADCFVSAFWCDLTLRAMEEAVRWIDVNFPTHLSRNSLAKEVAPYSLHATATKAASPEPPPAECLGLNDCNRAWVAATRRFVRSREALCEAKAAADAEEREMKRIMKQRHVGEACAGGFRYVRCPDDSISIIALTTPRGESCKAQTTEETT